MNAKDGYAVKRRFRKDDPVEETLLIINTIIDATLEATITHKFPLHIQWQQHSKDSNFTLLNNIRTKVVELKRRSLMINDIDTRRAIEALLTSLEPILTAKSVKRTNKHVAEFEIKASFWRYFQRRAGEIEQDVALKTSSMVASGDRTISVPHLLPTTMHELITYIETRSVREIDFECVEPKDEEDDSEEDGHDDDDEQNLCEAFARNLSLKIIYLGTHNLPEGWFSSIIDALSYSQSIEQLHIIGNDQTLGGVWLQWEIDSIALCIVGNESIKNLHIVGFGVHSEGIIPLGDALNANSTIKQLGIRECCFDDEASVDFGKFLQTNQTIETLQLNDNCFGDSEWNYDYSSDPFIFSICKALKVNRTLKKLDLSGISVTNKGRVALTEAVSSNQNSIKLVL